MRIKNIPKYKYLYATTDIFVLLFSYLFSFYLVGINKQFNFYRFEYLEIFNIIGFITISSFFIYIFQINQLYTNAIIITRKYQILKLVKSIFTGLLFLTFITLFFLFSLKINFLFVTLSFLISASFLMYIFRIEILRNVYLKLKHKYLQKKIIIIGGGANGKYIASQLKGNDSIGFEMVGFVDDNITKGTDVFDGIKTLGGIKQLESLIKENDVNEIIIASDTNNHQEFFELLGYCAQFGIEMKIASDLFNPIQQKIFIEKYAGIPFIEIFPRYFNSKRAIQFKRSFDIVVSLFGLILLTPLFAMIIAAIKSTSKGPAIFKQARVGKDGKNFQFYKFRSMKVINGEDSERKKMMIDYIKNENASNGSTKVINESRVTKVGKFLRKVSLDELPQLFNVLRGDMSIVGPRPCLPYEYEHYEEWQKRRSTVKPGCTGIWQVTARSSVSFTDSILLDLYYVNNMSPSLDLQLLFRTIPVMVFAKGGK